MSKRDQFDNNRSDKNIEKEINHEDYSGIYERSYQPTVDELDDSNPPTEDSGSNSNSDSSSND